LTGDGSNTSLTQYIPVVYNSSTEFYEIDVPNNVSSLMFVPTVSSNSTVFYYGGKPINPLNPAAWNLSEGVNVFNVTLQTVVDGVASNRTVTFLIERSSRNKHCYCQLLC